MTVKPEFFDGSAVSVGAVTVVNVEPIAAVAGAITPPPVSSTTETSWPEALNWFPTK